MEYVLQVEQTANRMRIWSSNKLQKDVIWNVAWQNIFY